MKKTTILIIDDESSIRRLISKVLLKEGYDILTADGGEKAVEIALANKIDLALVDLKMPGIDGIETIRRIKKTNSGAAFIIITAFAEMSSLKDALELGVFDYITKPFDLEYLKHLVRHIVTGVRPGVLPYFEDTRQTLDGRLELGQLKKKKMDAFKEDIKERMAVLKEEDNYIDRTIAGSCDSLAGLIKYKTKKFMDFVDITQDVEKLIKEKPEIRTDFEQLVRKGPGEPGEVKALCQKYGFGTETNEGKLVNATVGTLVWAKRMQKAHLPDSIAMAA